MWDSKYFIVGLVAAVVVMIALASTIFFGVPLRFGFGGQITDVITVKDTAQLIRQDASQRVIVLVPKMGEQAFIACSEPPPDIAQNLAQNLDTSLRAFGKRDKVEGEIAADISEDLRVTAEFLFQRSQGIQLLRDTMFRLCEMFQNEVINGPQYVAFMRDLLSTANFIIPFEQCTGMLKSVAVSEIKERDLLLSECLSAAFSFAQYRSRQD